MDVAAAILQLGGAIAMVAALFALVGLWPTVLIVGAAATSVGLAMERAKMARDHRRR